MPSPHELTSQAHELVRAGDLLAAQELLHAVLDGADPRPAVASPELAEAAALHAQVLVRLGELAAARGWAAFAHAAATHLHGPSDPRTVAAAATLAAILHRVGSHARAARLYRQVIIELTATDGPESPRVLAAEADLATVEYARGDCGPARDRMENAWQLHREVYGEGHPSGIKMLARLGTMHRDCGLAGDAEAYLALARRLCREHLPTDHPLALQVAALTAAPAGSGHRCPAEAAAGDSTAAGEETAGDRPPPILVPPPREAVDEEYDGVRTIRYQPAPTPEPEREPPSERESLVPFPSAADPPARRVLPIVVAGLLVALVGTTAAVAGLTGDDEEPAPVTRSPAPSRSANPSAAATVTAAPPGAPPADVRLRDNRDSITLTWRYPAGVEGPVVVSGGRTGQQPQAFQQLAPGSTSYVVYGLPDRLDYCFSISIVYSTEQIGRADPVCTDRSTRDPGR